MSTNPRNPRYFPRMKVRGQQRLRQAPWDRTLRSIDKTAEAFNRLAKTLAEFPYGHMKAQWVEFATKSISEKVEEQ